MSGRRSPRGGGKRPPFQVYPDYQNVRTEESEALWAKRNAILPAYRDHSNLTEGALVFANMIERAAAEPEGWIEAAGLLPADLARRMEGAHDRLVGTYTPRPLDYDELRSNPEEREAAQRWSVEVFEDESLASKFAAWVPLVGEAMTDGDPQSIAAARDELVKRCWAKQVWLKQPPLRHYYDQVVATMPGFVPFAEYVATKGICGSSEAASIFVARWRATCYSKEGGVTFRAHIFRAEFKEARHSAGSERSSNDGRS